MAWPSLGAQSFITFSGRVQPRAEESEEISREGEDGHEYRTIGTRSKPTQHRTERDVADAAAAETLEDAYRAMKSTAVTLTYPDQRDRTVFVVDVQIERVRTEEAPAGGVAGGAVIVSAVWTLQSTE